ncbi:MAG: ABC transporter permease, partial [Alphaproteobacteria bacterium]
MAGLGRADEPGDLSPRHPGVVGDNSRAGNDLCRPQHHGRRAAGADRPAPAPLDPIVADAPAIPLADPAEALRRARQGNGYWRRVWERLRQDRVTLAIAAILMFLLIMVIFAPWFSAHDPYEASILRRLKPVGFPGHWLGTDEVGRDLWARMVYGGRMSLLAGVLPVFLALLIGGFLGILAGYAGGLVNSAIMRLTDVLYAFPSVLLAIAITGILGSGLRNTILALTIAFVPPLIRISESVAAQARHLDYVD